MIDTHAHYDDKRFDNDRDALLNTLKKEGVEYIINPSVNLESAKKCIELANKFGFIFTAVGIHPHDADTYNEKTIEILRKMIQENPKVVAVGEVGLDYHYDFVPRSIQKECLKQHIRLAKEEKLPLIIHSREAHGDILKIVKSEAAYEAGGVFHCFSGSVEMAYILIDLGFYISLGGAVTFRNAKKSIEVARKIPLDRLLVETDSPYMAPVPHRGKRNNSGYVRFVLGKIAEIRNLSYEEIEEITTHNAKKLFKLL